MYKKDYSNFVRPEFTNESWLNQKRLLDGETVKKLYLEEVCNIPASQSRTKHRTETRTRSFSKRKTREDNEELSNQKLFICVENNDVDTLRNILDSHPDKINTVDDYGWSLLMIACQANSINIVKELLKHGVDTTIKDKAGNSAQSLVIRNKNVHLANILLNFRNERNESDNKYKDYTDFYKPCKSKHQYTCSVCDDKTFDDKEEHLSSTIHNINASKGIKVPTKYIIPESNKGFQLMLKGGWNKESGLGRDGSGSKYPVKAVLKRDKIGLGHEKNKNKKLREQSELKCFRKKVLESSRERNRRLEILFRREFY